MKVIFPLEVDDFELATEEVQQSSKNYLDRLDYLNNLNRYVPLDMIHSMFTKPLDYRGLVNTIEETPLQKINILDEDLNKSYLTLKEDNLVTQALKSFFKIKDSEDLSFYYKSYETKRCNCYTKRILSANKYTVQNINKYKDPISANRISSTVEKELEFSFIIQDNKLVPKISSSRKVYKITKVAKGGWQYTLIGTKRKQGFTWTCASTFGINGGNKEIFKYVPEKLKEQCYKIQSFSPLTLYLFGENTLFSDLFTHKNIIDFSHFPHFGVNTRLVKYLYRYMSYINKYSQQQLYVDSSYFTDLFTFSKNVFKNKNIKTKKDILEKFPYINWNFGTPL